MHLQYKPIGTIRTPFKELAGMPIQPTGAADVSGRVLVDPAYAPGLQDLEGFSHLILLYHFHRSEGFELKVIPFMDDRQRGLFATRAPRRPNPIGLSVVNLIRCEGRILHIRGIDVLDATPLLDIKPYVPMFDAVLPAATGWLEEKAQWAATQKADSRFTE